jgi:ATP-dependent RNA helicase DeaD
MSQQADFASLGLSEATLEALKNMGYESPTSVQKETIPLTLEGHDLVVQSRTGTGKTGALGIPIVEGIDLDRGEVQAVVLTPTRELALQVKGEVERIGAGRGVKVVAIYGGESIDAQIGGIEAGAHVVVGTPGRVLDLLKRGSLKFDAVTRLVLDEADRMLDMGFAQEMSEIMRFMPEKRQTALFSATIPLGIRGLIYHYLNEPRWVLLSEDFAYVKEVRHTYLIAPKMHKDEVLAKLIEYDQPTSSMIFCNTREEVRGVANFLSRRGLPVAMISSDLTQRKREQVMAGFRAGRIHHLVATDVAARGIDIEELSHVFIYSTPDSPEAYIHRAGRTGRIGRGGEVISLVGATDLVSFNRLANRYHLDLVERSVPTDEEVLNRRTARLVAEIAEKAKSVTPEDIEALKSVSEAIASHPDRDRLMAQLILSNRPEPEALDQEDEQEARASRPPEKRGRRRRSGSRRRRRSQ